MKLFLFYLDSEAYNEVSLQSALFMAASQDGGMQCQ